MEDRDNFHRVNGDITTFKGDAIVNSLGTKTTEYGKLCNAIVTADNNPELVSFIKDLDGKAKVLDCYITDRNDISAKHIIHVVAPYRKDDYLHEQYISAYVKVLNLAREKGYHKIGVPIIGTGPNGYSTSFCKDIVIKLCNKYCECFPEMDISLYFYRPNEAIKSNNSKIIKDIPPYDIDKLIDEINYYKSGQKIDGHDSYTYIFTKEFFLNPPVVDQELINETKRDGLLRQRYQDNFHTSIDFTDKKYNNCRNYIDRYLRLRYGDQMFDSSSKKVRDRIVTLFGGGDIGKSNYDHLGEKTSRSIPYLLKVALACEMNTNETNQLLMIYGGSTSSLSNRETAIYTFISHQLYDIELIGDLLKQNYGIDFLYF